MKNEGVNKPQMRKSCHMAIGLRHRQFPGYEGRFQSCSYITGPESKTFAWIKIMEAEKLSESYVRSYLIHLTV